MWSVGGEAERRFVEEAAHWHDALALSLSGTVASEHDGHAARRLLLHHRSPVRRRQQRWLARRLQFVRRRRPVSIRVRKVP